MRLDRVLVLEAVVLSSLMTVVCAATPRGARAATTRQYFIAAEDGTWDFAPSGKNLVHCDVGPPPCDIPEPWTNSHTFPVTRYIQYTNANFTTKVPQPEWLGILGPIIRAEVGDTVNVHFCNHATSGMYGMHPHGFRYDKDSEGAHYEGVNSGQAPGAGAEVEPGACFDYVWHADLNSGPARGDLTSVAWWYHSHIGEAAETNAGLLGPIIITREGKANPDGSPNDVTREFVTAFFIFDKADGEENGLMHGINGYIFGNLRGLVMHVGEKVRWHTMAMGNEVDLHSPHWHGKTVKVGRVAGHRTDVVQLLPATTVTADMEADNPGEWMLHCHVSDHIAAGMMTTYQILP